MSSLQGAVMRLSRARRKLSGHVHINQNSSAAVAGAVSDDALPDPAGGDTGARYGSTTDVDIVCVRGAAFGTSVASRNECSTHNCRYA